MALASSRPPRSCVEHRTRQPLLYAWPACRSTKARISRAPAGFVGPLAIYVAAKSLLPHHLRFVRHAGVPHGSYKTPRYCTRHFAETPALQEPAGAQGAQNSSLFCRVLCATARKTIAGRACRDTATRLSKRVKLTQLVKDHNHRTVAMPVVAVRLDPISVRTSRFAFWPSANSH